MRTWAAVLQMASSLWSSMSSKTASFKLCKHSLAVRPWPFAPGISGQDATYHSPSRWIFAVNFRSNSKEDSCVRSRCFFRIFSGRSFCSPPGRALLAYATNITASRRSMQGKKHRQGFVCKTYYPVHPVNPVQTSFFCCVSPRRVSGFLTAQVARPGAAAVGSPFGVRGRAPWRRCARRCKTCRWPRPFR
jgi:hypothetical protein